MNDSGVKFVSEGSNHSIESSSSGNNYNIHNNWFEEAHGEDSRQSFSNQPNGVKSNLFSQSFDSADSNETMHTGEAYEMTYTPPTPNKKTTPIKSTLNMDLGISHPSNNLSKSLFRQIFTTKNVISHFSVDFP